MKLPNFTAIALGVAFFFPTASEAAMLTFDGAICSGATCTNDMAIS
ncbi:MAG: hypothetical protein ACI9BW_002929 [Gammaproteobacteria bacterium]|jgi:hypothetical protein